MKLLALLLTFTILFFSKTIPAYAATIPLVDNPKTLVHPAYQNIATMKLKDFQQLIGRKLTLKEKLGFLILKHKIRHQQRADDSDGKTSLFLGFAGLTLLVIGFAVPVLFLGALVASILAIVIGSAANKKDGDNKKARMGKLLGWLTLGALVLLAILAVILIASWTD